MKIVGFGDSFIINGGPNERKYLDQLGSKLNLEVEIRCQPGIGPWHAFLILLNIKTKSQLISQCLLGQIISDYIILK